MAAQYVLSFAMTLFEILFYSMSVGWPLITLVLKSEGYYSHLCDDNTEYSNSTESHQISKTTASEISTTNVSSSYTTCDEQDEMYTLIYCVIILVSTTGMFFNGLLFNKIGTWVCRAIGIAFYCTGCLMIATSTSESSLLIFIGVSCIGYSGSMIYITAIQYSNLFPKIKSTMVSLLTGIFLSATLTFSLLTQLYRSGVSFSSMFFVFSAVSVFSLLTTLFLTPRMFIPTKVEVGYRYGIQAECTKKEGRKEKAEEMALNETGIVAETVTEKVPTVWECIKTRFYIFTVVQLWILHVRNITFLANLSSWIESMTQSEEETVKYTDIFSLFLFLCGPASLLIGFVTDALLARFFKQNIPKELGRLKAYAISGALVSSVAIVFSVLILIPCMPLQYFSFTVYTLLRSSIYGFAGICFAGKFPIKYSGTLIGLSALGNGALSFVSEPLLRLTNDSFGGDFTAVNIGILILCVFSYVHPINLYLEYRKGLRMDRENH